MAIFSKILIATTLIFSLVSAAPLKQRDVITDIVTETEWTTVDMTTTVYIDGPEPTDVTTTAMDMSTFDHTDLAKSTSSALPTSAMTTAPSPAVVQSTSVTTPTSVSSIVTPAMIPAVTPMSSMMPPPPPASTSTSATPTVSQGSAGLVQAAASTPSPTPSMTANTASSGQGPASASDTANCEGEGDACVGDITYWGGGLGACGLNVDTTSQLAIALPYEFMGTLSNSNPYCGRTVTVYNPDTGISAQATVMDKCMGCVNRAIDCTEDLFNTVAPNGNGRVSGVEWWLN